jgi:hypothetical protein
MEPETISKNGASLKSHTSRVLFCLSVCILLLSTSCRTAKIYTKPNVSAYTTKHKTLAILPVTKHVIPTRYSNSVKATLFSNAEPFQTQEDMASAFYKFIQKGRMHIEIQDVEKTNRILKQIGFFENSTTSMSSQELAEILGVDALLLTNCQLRAYKNVAGGIALAIAGFPYLTVWGIMECLTVHETNEVVIKLYDGATNELLWNYNHKFLDMEPEAIIKKTGKKMPYYRK